MYSKEQLTEQSRDQPRECDQRDRNPPMLLDPRASGLSFQASNDDLKDNASQHSHTNASYNVSPGWLAREILKRTDVSNGEICMFQYPTTFRYFDCGTNGGGGNFIQRHCSGNFIGSSSHSTLNAINAVDRDKIFHVLNENDLQRALELILNEDFVSGRNNANNNGRMDIEDDSIRSEEQYEEQLMIQPSYMQNSSQESRDQITRLQFSWYDFQSFPTEIVGRAFTNLQHVDIRQNATLTCIESIAQLPNLISLNLSDCPNIRSLVPLADALHSAAHRQQNIEAYSTVNVADSDVDHAPVIQHKRKLNLRHLWVRGCNLSGMTSEEWSLVFDALAESTGPLERLTLSRNEMSFLHGGIGKLKSLAYLFVEDNNVAEMTRDDHSRRGFELPDELGSLPCLRFASFSGNNLTRLPRTMGRLNDDCDVHLHRNPNLKYPPLKYLKSVKGMRMFFHKERMSLFIGATLFMPHMKRGQLRANERLYQPGGSGYFASKERFEEIIRIYELRVVCRGKVLQSVNI